MYDIPPTENNPAPERADDFQRELVSIAGLTDTNLPHLRLVWGQASNGPLASTYFFNGELHLTYRHHVKKTPLLAFPVRDLTGKIVDYDVYKRGDVMPADGRVPVVKLLKEDIGIPRWFIEQAWAIDPDGWEAERQLSIAGKGEDPGPCPQGGTHYEEMYCLSVHKNGCCDAQGLMPNQKRCWGEYRGPSQVDLTVLREIEAKMRATEGWAGNEGWRSPAVARDVRLAVQQHHAQDAERDYREDLERQYLIASQLKPHIKRLTTEGSGMDLEKYSFVPSNYKKKKRKRHATTDTGV